MIDEPQMTMTRASWCLYYVHTVFCKYRIVQRTFFLSPDRSDFSSSTPVGTGAVFLHAPLESLYIRLCVNCKPLITYVFVLDVKKKIRLLYTIYRARILYRLYSSKIGLVDLASWMTTYLCNIV